MTLPQRLEEFWAVVVGRWGVDGEAGDEVGGWLFVATFVDIADVVGAFTIVVEFGKEGERHYEGEFPFCFFIDYTYRLTAERALS